METNIVSAWYVSRPQRQERVILKTAAATYQPAMQLGFAPALLAVFLCILFGANPVALKISLTGIGVFTTAALRFTLAAVVLAAWAILTGRPLAVTKRQALQLANLAAIFFLQVSIFYFGQSTTTAAHGVLISNLLPFVVMIMAHFFLNDDRISPRKVAGLTLGFAGVALLFCDAVTLLPEMIRGDLLILSAVLVWGCNVIYMKRIIADFTPMQITLHPMLLSIPLFYLAGYFLDGDMIRDLSPRVVASLAYQGIVTASFGYVMWNSLVSRYGATALHSFVFLMPVSGVALGLVLLGEELTPNLIGSIGFVVAGLIVINWRGRRS